jgi:hypothetical protein
LTSPGTARPILVKGTHSALEAVNGAANATAPVEGNIFYRKSLLYQWGDAVIYYIQVIFSG